MPPVFGQFDLALLFEANGVLSGLRNCLCTVCLQQLPRIFVDFDLSHGVTLLLVLCATVIELDHGVISNQTVVQVWDEQ